MDLYAIVLLIIVACMPFGAVAQETCSKEASNKQIMGEMMILLSTLNNKVYDQGDLIQALSEKSLAQTAEIDSLKTENAELRERGSAQETEINSLTTEVARLTETGSTQETEIISLTTQVSGLTEKVVRQDTLIANQDEVITTLQAKVDSQETVNSNQAQEITAIQDKVDSQEAVISNQAQEITAIEDKVDSQETVISNQAEEITAIQDKDHDVVAFSAYNSASAQEVSYGQVIPYSQVITNTGHYNDGTSTFTAPVRGIYFFFVNVLSSDGQTNNLRIMRNVANEARVYAHAAGDSHASSASMTVAVQCEPGDSVRVLCASTCKLNTGFYNRFSGFLLKRN